MSNDRAEHGSRKAMESNKQNPYSTTLKQNNALVKKGVMLNSSSYRYNEITAQYGDIEKITPIAWYNASDINNITKTLSDTRIYHGGVKNVKNEPKYLPTDNVNGAVYQNLFDNGFFNDIANKKQTGSELYNKLITYDKTRNIMTNKSSSMNNLMNFNTLNNNLHKVNDILTNGGTISVFDTETISGINQFGHSTLSNITEISGVQFEVENGTATIKKRVNTVLGFTSKEAEDARKKLDIMMSKDPKQWTNEEKVFFDRMNIYGNSHGKQNGFSFEITKAKGIEDIHTSRAYAEKGISFLENVAKQQEEWMAKAGITDTYEQYRIKQLQEFKQMLKNSDIAQGHNVSEFDMRQLNIATGDNSPLTNIFDTLGVTNYSMNELGANSIYAKNANRKNFTRGRATQEVLAEAHNLKDVNAASHIAINDVMENALFLFGDMNGGNSIEGTKFNISNNSYFKKVMMPNMKAVNDIMQDTASLYTGGNQLYYMDYTMQKNWATQDGSLSFEYNPGDKSFKTYDGYTIKNNKVSNSGYNAFGPRKGALYTHNVYELEMNENFKKQFMNISGAGEEQANKIFQQYANATNLYVVESKQYMDIESLTKKLGSRELAEHYINNAPTTYTIETNYNRLGANLGVNVAEIVDGKIVANEKAIKGLGFKSSKLDQEGVFIQSTDSLSPKTILNTIIDKSYDRTINDSAARKLRELDYKKLMQIRNYQKDLVNNKGINSSTPIVTRISQLVSQGKDIDLSTHQEIVNALGWHDYKADLNKTVKETVNSALALDGYVSKMGSVFDSIDEILDETYGKLPDISTPEKFSRVMSDKKNRELLMKRDLGFKQLYNDFLDDISLANPVTGNSWTETYHTAADLNKVDFFTHDLAPEKIAKRVGGSPRNFTTNVTSVDLNKPNGLLDTFYNLKFKDLDARGLVNKKGNAGFDALHEAYKAIREDKRFGKQLFKNIDINDHSIGVDALNDMMTNELLTFVNNKRANDLSFGYINPRMNQDVIASSVADYVSTVDKSVIKKSIEKNKGNLVNDFKLITADGGREAAINDLVENYFLTFSKNDLDLSNFTDVQKSYMKKQYDIARRTAEEKAGSLIDAIKNTDIQLALTNTPNGQAVSLIQGNNVTELSNLFKFNHRKGILTTQIGTEEYALKMGLGRDQNKNFRLSNGVEKIANRHLDHMNAQWAAARGDSIVDAIAYNNNLTASLIRDTSSRIDISNGQLLSQGFHFDANELVSALPELYKDGTIAKIESKFDIKEDARKSLRSIVDDINNNPRKYKDKAFTKILPVQLNFFSDNYLNPLLESVINNPDRFTVEERELLKGIGVKTKNTALFKGFLSGIEEYYVDPLAGLDNDARPPVTQMQNVRLYDKDATTDAVSKLQKTKSDIYKNLNATSVYTSDSMEKFLYNNTSSTGKAASSGLTMKYMQIDTYSLRNQFLDEKNISSMNKYLENNFDKSDLERAQKVISDRTRKLSTYEQQSSMDARVHDINFHRSNTQTINAKKKLIANHKDNLDVIKNVEDQQKLFFSIDEKGRINYELGIKVKKGDNLGRFGTEQFSQEVMSKYDGMFRGRYFDTHGNVVSEQMLNKVIKDSGIDVTDNNAIISKLDSMFTFKYQVLGMEELHGTKAFLGASEKTTIDSMKIAVGEIDSGLRKTLINNGMGDIVGKVVSKDYLNEVVSVELSRTFGKKGAANILDKIFKERYAFSDAVHAIDAFKDVTFITNLDVNKHSSATALMHDGLNYLKDHGELTEANLDKIFGAGNYKLTDGQVKILPGLKEVQLKFDEGILRDAFNRTDNIVKDSNGKEIGYTGKAHIVSVIDDPAGTSSGIFNGEVRGKGVKFTDAMGRNLDRQTYNIDGLQKVYDHYKELGDLEEFKKVFGHALDLESFENGVLAFNKDYANQSMAAPATDILRRQLVKSNHKETLLDIANGNNRRQYEHLLSSVSRAEWGNISVDRAEIMYSHIMGNNAIKINYENTKAIVERFLGDGHKQFKMLDWTKDNPDWLDLQIGGQGKTVIHSDLNPYTNNLIIKTGLGGSEEFLAIARMPEIHAGDNLIQEKHISMLTGLQTKIQGLKAGTTSKDIVRDHIKLFKSQMIEDVNGKNGLIKELTEYRMNQSFMGKGSGVIMAGLDNKGNSLLGAGDVETLNRVNADIFKTATFNGKTLNQHYAEGKVIDSVFMGEQAFRDMGYFDQEFMDKTFSNLNDDFRKKLNIDQLNSIEDTVLKAQVQEDAMKHLLRTQGDSFITVRYPEIMQGSDKFAMGYLDDSLKANEVRVLGPTGMSAKLDFDGDMFNVARMATEDGLSRLNTVVAAEADAEALALSNAIDSSIITRATTDNAYWQKQVDDFMTGKKGLESMSRGMDINEIASHKLINGKAYMASLDKSEEELFNLFNKYSKIIGNKDLKDDSLISAIHEIDNSENAIHDYVAAKSWSDRRDMITAKVYNNAIGETNVTNQKIKSEISGLLPKDAPDYEYKSNLLVDFLYQAEEQAISSKSSVEGLVSDRAQQWNRSVSGLMKGTGSRELHLENMESWLDTNLRGKLAPGLYFTKSETFANKMFDNFGISTLEEFNAAYKDSDGLGRKIDDILIKDIVDIIDTASSMDNAAEVFESLKISSSQSGGDHRIAQNMYFIADQETNLKTIYNAYSGMWGENLSSNLDANEFKNNKQFRASIQETISEATENVGKVSTEAKIGGIIDGIGDFAKSVKGRNLAKGAIGIAAGIMVAGFVGGRPRPADVHAMEEASDYQTPMEGYQLADPGMMPGGSQQGYVININARTNKGRDNAARALQQAIASGGNANINIAMNITDNYGNINDRDIENAILGAL